MAAKVFCPAAIRDGRSRPATLEEPGKILHEHRTGDLSEAGISLRRPYYGNIDATALFVALYADTVEAQVSDSLEDDLYESVTAAAEWILDTVDEDGFLRLV